MLLPQIQSPADLRNLSADELDALCAEIRDALITAVSRTGGHLGPNLGMVELTVALHRVFDSPRDAIVFDTGHQAYVHKMLTGRLQDFETLRQRGGLSGYPSRSESKHDLVENSHASTGLSYALALAAARDLRGTDERIICVVGDGSLTGGMAYEALNNIGHDQRQIIIVLNDNGRSYAPTVGGIAENLGQLRLSPHYEAAKDVAERTLRHVPKAYEAARRMKDSLKQLVAPISFFETLGLKYGGPIDGHDVHALEKALHDAALIKGPVVIHVVTEKGHGYGPAVGDEIDKFHGVSKFDPENGKLAPKAQTWTDVFGEYLSAEAEKDERICAITAAMASSTGLLDFSQRFPDRFFDVGIAEQHAVTFAAGLAMRGLRPVVCIYSSFLQRAFDQVVCDVALHNLPVVFVLDRAGITGDDGPSHHGMLDMAYLRMVPNLVVCAPSSQKELQFMLRNALQHNGPFAIRYPRGVLPLKHHEAIEDCGFGKCRVLRSGSDIAIVAAGKMVEPALSATEQLVSQGLDVTLIDARFIKPLDKEMLELIAAHRGLVTIEDGIAAGGFGSAVLESLAEHDIAMPCRRLALPDRFVEHGQQQLLLDELNLNAEAISEVATSLLVSGRRAAAIAS